MGYTQRDWLVDKLKQSTATWNVVGQQVLMSKMWIPAELLASLGKLLQEELRLMRLLR